MPTSTASQTPVRSPARRATIALLVVLMGLLPACASSSRGGARGSSATYGRHAVAADHPLASEAGLEVLRAGGNAVDAAVATSFALSVVRPFSCGIGGGGFMVVHFEPGQEPRATEPPQGSVQYAINYREVAPSAITPNFYASPHLPTGEAAPSRIGGAAAGVPGTVAGLMRAHDAFGLLPREQVLAPAIRLAESGFTADAAYVRAAETIAARFREHPLWQERFAFVWERHLHHGSVREGDLIHVPEQALALRLIASQGVGAFYFGPIAEAIVRAVQNDGGLITRQDLEAYRPSAGAPLEFQAMGRRFITMPPPSSGGITLAQTLGILARLEQRPASAEPESSPTARDAALIEAFKLAFADRAAWLGDPLFVPIPTDRLLSATYLDSRAALADPQRTRQPDHYLDPAARAELSEDGGTSHLSVVDRWGNAVACTETINLEFGSLLAVPEYGFILNDQMDDFTSRVGEANAFGLRQSARNLPAPGKRPLSSMTPTIVLGADGRVEVIAGASGGPRIITGTTLAILHALDGRTARQAVAAPRFHHQWMPDRLDVEPEVDTAPRPTRSAAGFTEAMRARGHQVREIERLCVVQLIRRAPDGRWEAASDPRKGGRPAGD